MWLIIFAWKNMWRNRYRTIISMAAIFFAVILSVIAGSLKEGIFDNLVKNVVSFYSGYAQIHKKGYWDEQVLDNSFESTSATAQRILNYRNVSGITRRLESFALLSSGDVTRGSMVVGIDPEKEIQVTQLDKKVIQGSYLNRNDTAVLLAQGLAERLKFKVADTILLIGQGYHGATAAGKYIIKGIVKFGSPDLNEKALFMPMAAAQDFYSADGMITSYVISLHNTRELGATVSALRSLLGEEYEVMDWGTMMPDIRQHIAADSNNMKYVQGILYMLICFGIFGTLLMMMVERKFELGMLVAIGMKKTKLVLLLLFESVLTVVAGCAIGILLSVPIVFYLNRHPLRIGGETARAYERFGFEAVFPASVDTSIFLDQGLAVIGIGLIMSIYQVFKVIRLNPVKAMKK